MLKVILVSLPDLDVLQQASVVFELRLVPLKLLLQASAAGRMLLDKLQLLLPHIGHLLLNGMGHNTFDLQRKARHLRAQALDLMPQSHYQILEAVHALEGHSRVVEAGHLLLHILYSL